MRNWLAVLGVLLVALILVSTQAQAKSAASAEKGTWEVKVMPDDEASAKGEKESDDTLTFMKGKFHSTGCDPYGFGPAAYKMDGNTWMSDTESKTDGRLHWHGEVSGDTINGRMTWTKPDGTVLNYTFEGHRAGAQ